MEFTEKNSRGKFKSGLVSHLVNTTAIQTVVSPILATLETTMAGMSDEKSLNARLLGAGLGYLGLGFVYAKGLLTSRKIFYIVNNTRERTKQLHDSIYSVAYCLALQPALYLVAGLREPKEIVIATAGAIGLGFVIGGPVGYSVDLFGDFTGTRKNKRVSDSLEALATTLDKDPILNSVTHYIAEKVREVKESINNLRQGTKRGIVAGITVGAIGLTAGVYGLTSNNQPSVSQINVPQIVQPENNK